ncbi:hypothetical protein ACLOJK_013694 [Asimina triloba]
MLPPNTITTRVSFNLRRLEKNKTFLLCQTGIKDNLPLPLTTLINRKIADVSSSDVPNYVILYAVKIFDLEMRMKRPPPPEHRFHFRGRERNTAVAGIEEEKSVGREFLIWVSEEMYAVQRLSSYISHGVYTVSGPFHPFGGAVDIIVVQQQDGSFKSSPWYVRFGKFQGVLKTREKVVDISVNGIEAGFNMYLDHKGEAFFLREIDGDDADGTFSPLSSGDETDERIQNGRLLKAQSLNLAGGKSNSGTQIDIDSQKIVKRATSQPPSLLGLVFGGRSMNHESSFRKGGSDKVRIHMSEVVDMAEEILDVNELTNSPAAASPVFGIVKPPEKGDDRAQVSEREDLHNPSVLDGVDHDFILPDLHETVAMDGSFGISTTDTDYLDEVKNPTLAYLHSQEQDLRISTSGVSELSSKCVVTSKQSSGETREVSSVDNVDGDEIANQLISEATVNDSHSPSFADPGEGSTIISNISRQCDERLESIERESLLISQVFHEGSNGGEVFSNLCCEKSVSMRVGRDEQQEKVEVHTQVLYNTAEQISENDCQQESGLSDGMSQSPKSAYECDANIENSTAKGIVDGQMLTGSLSLLGRDMLSSDSVTLNTVEVVHQDTLLSNKEKIEAGQAETFENQSQAVGRDMLSSDSVMFNTVKVVHQDTLLSNKEKTEAGQVETFENQSQVVIKTSHLCCNNEEGEQIETCDPLDKPVGGASLVDSIKGDTSQGRIAMSSLNDSIHQVQPGEDLCLGYQMHNLEVPSVTPIMSQESNASGIEEKAIISRMPTSENLEEDDYIFRDIDNPAVGPWDDMVSPTSREADNHMMEDTEEEHELNNMNCSLRLSFGSRSYSTAGSYASELILDSSPTAPEDSPRESGPQTIPVTIPKSHFHEVGVGSVPNFQHHLHDLGSYDILQPLSRSLDSSRRFSNCDLDRKNSISKAASESNLAKHHPTTESVVAVVDSENKKSPECQPINPSVEISLCKHLLFEGMGADAASQAFDAEKIDMEKFKTHGPSLMKNDKLVVRINGHYLPWTVAAPIVLGMVCFGNKQIFELKGMIAVEKKEKGIEGEATVSSSGSWRLWTFFKKSKGNNSVHSASSGNKGTEADNNLLESASNISGDKNFHEVSAIKKLVRSVVPTSEQLASLDLKEGRNAVTFTFSTAMLGRQQVDARIYLWKWNTRIVISDVDGTITKSDVLGQFMPLVGKDWSHLGVAHLFSAIKVQHGSAMRLRIVEDRNKTVSFVVVVRQYESNRILSGEASLCHHSFSAFLESARAISQAYLTRQFLVNLKQDGKALPDGPVVISPDGLFPSLFREGIFLPL